MPKEITVMVNGSAAKLEVGASTVVSDLACQLQDLGYTVDVINPKVVANGQQVEGLEKVKANVTYYFSK